VARNLSNLYKSNKSILKDLKGFVRFLSWSDTHFQMFFPVRLDLQSRRICHKDLQSDKTKKRIKRIVNPDILFTVGLQIRQNGERGRGAAARHSAVKLG